MNKKAIIRALFIGIMPIYWLIIFKLFVQDFNPALFIFVSVASILMSLTSNGWGLLDNLAVAR